MDDEVTSITVIDFCGSTTQCQAEIKSGGLRYAQCNLDYPDLNYPAPQLSGYSKTQVVHWYASAEGGVS